MKFVQLIALLCFLSPLYSRVIQGDANYYYKVLRMTNPGASHSIASRAPSLDRNCFFSPVQCMLPVTMQHPI
ncbi:unnamed protein product [Heligmosomoides polygyrus]|uniref:Secreted protein n=1 Tax=Heligmosomoides polygyrus TaxID=6339 RepID=A0A183GE56_HELPZ|nr:unnamed protein product [Heligmosomoides polygyrus]